jgi:hypothetical protein
MRKILVVVVIACVACVEPLEPAPQTPVSTGTDPPSDVELTFGPVIASGTEAGRSWYLRGQIDARGAATWLEISTAGGGGGGGGIGALPFQDLGWTKLGHFGSVASGELQGIGVPRTLSVDGVVSKQTATIDVQLADGTSLPAQIIDTGDPRASFFVVVWPAPDWEVMIARDATGAELETFREPPEPSQRDVNTISAGEVLPAAYFRRFISAIASSSRWTAAASRPGAVPSL